MLKLICVVFCGVRFLFIHSFNYWKTFCFLEICGKRDASFIVVLFRGVQWLLY